MADFRITIKVQRGGGRTTTAYLSGQYDLDAYTDIGRANVLNDACSSLARRLFSNVKGGDE